MISFAFSRPVVYLKVGERYNFTAATRTDVDVKDAANNVIVAGTTIPAGTEVVALADTKVYLRESLTTEGSWVRRGGAGGPIQIGVIVPTTWTQDVVKKNGETWLKLNGQSVDSALYPALANNITVSSYQVVNDVNMTSNNAPAPYTASSSTEWDSGYAAWKAFDNTTGSLWQPVSGTYMDGTGNDWLMLDMGSPKTVEYFTMAGHSVVPTSGFYLEGSNDNSTWSNLGTWTGQYVDNTPQIFALNAPATYRYYRITLTNGVVNGTPPTIRDLRYQIGLSVLPNYGTNPQGQYYYIKADGYTNNGYTIADGSAGGQVLTWDDTLSQWVAGSGGSGGATYVFGDGLALDVGTSTVSLAYVDSVTGDFTFKNAIGNTAQSFRVANAADAPIFNIDTTSGIVSIGSGTTVDSTTVALLLDSSTVAPANPQNGMMYYDTTLAKFRCYEGGAWKNCVGGDSTPFRDNIVVGGNVTGFSANTTNIWLPFNLSATIGDVGLLSGNTITIPESGVYTISMSGGYQTSNTTGLKIQMISVNGASRAETRLDYGDITIQNNTLTYNFNAGDTVQFRYLYNSFGTMTTQPQWTLIRQGNSNLIDRPDLWTANIEYDFGDGLYGQRFTGAITAAANTYSYVMLFPSGSGIQQVISSGGVWRSDNNAAIVWNAISTPQYDSTRIFSLAINETDGGSLYISSKTANARNNCLYDVWVKYTK